MDPNDLKSFEIDYEILSRNLQLPTTQAKKRSLLRINLNKEKINKRTEFHQPYEFSQNIDELSDSLDEISELLESDDTKKPKKLLLRRINSRLVHVENRISGITPTETENNLLEEFNDRLLGLRTIYQNLWDSLLEPSTPLVGQEVNNQSTVTSVATPKPNRVPVYKWNITFSGDPRRENLISFLERVEELQEARGLSKEELFQSAIDLFSGPVLLYFRNIKSEVASWDELVERLKQDFLPVDFELSLMDDIRSRTQGPNENVMQYIDVMLTLFKRLTRPLTDKEKLTQIVRNLNPYFLDRVSLKEIDGVDQLKAVCREIQSTKSRTESYRPPSAKSLHVLDYSHSEQNICSGLQSVNLNSENASFNPSCETPDICWNCGETTHHYTACKQRKTMFCYKCGLKNVITPTCPFCRPKNEVKCITQGGTVLNAPQHGVVPKQSRVFKKSAEPSSASKNQNYPGSRK